MRALFRGRDESCLATTMDSGAEKVRKKQLLLLKKELKCWESMFERKHGRKPTKTDIDDSPLEIRDTYRQYQKVKNNVHGKEDVPDNKVEVKLDIRSGPKEQGGDEVFGASLNKKKILNEDCDKRSERQATWKLRKWTKREGYKTVVVNRHSVDEKSEEINDSVAPKQVIVSGTENDVTKASHPVEEISSEVPQLENDLEALSQEVKIRDVGGARKPPARSTSPVVAGQYSKRPSTPRKPRRGHCISAKWLERCQPDLSNIVTNEGIDADSGRTSVISSAPDAVCMVDRDMIGSPSLSPCHHGHEQDSDNSSESEDDSIPTADLLFRYSELSQTTSVGNVQVLPKSAAISPCVKVSDSVEAGDVVEKHTEFSAVSNSNVFSELESLSTGQAAKTVPRSHWRPTPSERDGQHELFEELTKPLQTCSTHLLSQDVDSAQPSSSTDLSTTSNVHHTQLPPQSQSAHLQRRSKSSLKQEMCSNLQPSEKQISSAEDDTKAKVTKLSARVSSSSLFSSKDREEKDQGIVDDQLSSPEDEKCTGALDSGTERKSQAKTSRSTSVSENFVRLNMKIKRYSKKPGRITGSAYKRKLWKKYQRSQEGAAGGSGGGGKGRNVCFRCGKPGHWAKNCTESGGSKNLGQFAGEKVQFSETVALQEDEVDEATLEQLAKDSPFPSVEEAALMARGIKPGGNKGAHPQESREEKDGCVASGSSDAMSNFVPPPPCYTPPALPPPAVEPLYPSENGRMIATPASVYTTLRKFGYESFRAGQEEAIRRILSGISTLVVLSTGAGKSLCYQLPAYLYTQKSPCIVLVISPLVALMEDQVRHFPLSLRGACLHTNQTQSQREKVLRDVVEGKVNVLLLSPEALVGGAFWSGRSTYSLSRLPPVAFACIDEAHCVSEWSHNFRPSYLRIYKVLKERLGVHCLLGLTATATCATALSVASHLGIAEENIIRGSMLPDNLHITASYDQDREQALVHLLQSPRMQGCHSIIIYCTRQQQTERISQLLRTCLQSLPVCPQEDNSDDEPSSLEEVNKMKRYTNSRKRKADRDKSVGWGKSSRKLRVDWSAECYHAGMSASQRKKVQTDFMTGKLRIVVATVAFGMGLNKADVRAIIHYNMPKSFESFVQEIGRAGRDGLPAFCHVFIDKEGSDMVELRRHTYSNTVDPYAIKQLVTKAFPKCKCKEVKQSSTATPNSSQDGPQSSQSSPKSLSGRIQYCAGHEVAIPIEATVQALDVREECLSTLLCYLELQSWLEVLNPVNDTCTLKCYGGPRQLRALARKLPSVAAAIARLREQGAELDHSSTVSFSVVGLSDSMGWESRIVKSELRDLQYNDRQTSSKPGVNSTVLVEFSNLSFHLRSPGDLTTEERDLVCDFLCKKVKKQEESEIRKLHLLHAVLQSVSCNNFYECFCEKDTDQNQVRLKALIHQYFKEELECEHMLQLRIPVTKTEADLSLDLINRICQDIHALVTIHTDQKFTGRAIARIFHGIASPCFPAEVWGRQPRFWRKHLGVDFNLLCQIATRKLVELR